MTKSELESKYDLKIFTDNIEDKALTQLESLMGIEVFSDKKVRIMPDVHAGAGCVIGFTANLGDKVVPYLVGVDLGCGVRVINLGKYSEEIDFHKFYEYIYGNVPSGKIAREERFGFKPLKNGEEMDIYREAKDIVKKLRCFRDLKNLGYINKSIGTLGAGNHYIELDRGEESGNLYLVIHTGSRNLGKQVAEIYQKIALKNHQGWDKLEEEKKELIARMKAAGERDKIQEAIKDLHRNFKPHRPDVPEDLCWLEGQCLEDYIYDMRLCQRWAVLNRQLIGILLKNFFPGVEVVEEWESIHNYLGDDDIIRKGAISAREGELCIIPLNMKDGAIIGVGKGNSDWNFSAPHGAGRLLSRTDAREKVTMEMYKESMNGVYSESITDVTLDEAPMVYKPAEEIMSLIGDTIDIKEVIKPIFNFKGGN